MAVELAQVAAGLPAAASLAVAGGLTSFREGRRRAALNEAMHELRRPLQVLALALPSDSPQAAPAQSSLRLAAGALERLDREINGAGLEEAVVDVSVEKLVDEAAQRWCKAATRAGVSLRVERHGADACIEGNPFDLAQALDNLLSNAIEHGEGTVRIEWRRIGGQARIRVTDGGRPRAAGARRPRRGRGCRRGHGLRVVGRIARSHGGSFTLRRTSHGAEASLFLPLSRRVEER